MLTTKLKDTEKLFQYHIKQVEEAPQAGAVYQVAIPAYQVMVLLTVADLYLIQFPLWVENGKSITRNGNY